MLQLAKILLGDYILQYQGWAHKVNLAALQKKVLETEFHCGQDNGAVFLNSRKTKTAYLNTYKNTFRN